ncbi:hypothetical protein J3F83DRAFT_761845 [Trichoderma novae-zelandiae]
METQSTAFPQFALFPVELRLAIWFHCLPHRVVQRDGPFKLTGLRQKHKCWSEKPSLQNAAPPLIASGEMFDLDHDWNLGPVWIQRRLDSYHLNFIPEVTWGYGWDVEMLSQFLIEGHVMLDAVPLSLPPEYFFKFDLEMRHLSVMRSTPYIKIKDDLVDEDLNMVYKEFAYNYPRPFSKVSLSATMAFISIHAERTHAVASGLFGLLLDAPVRLVDFDDEQRIRSFHALFETDSSNHKNGSAWREKVDWLMMATAWLRARMNWEECISFDGDPHNEHLVYMAHKGTDYENLFDDENPWVIQAKRELPRVAPKLLFMLCTDHCDANKDVYKQSMLDRLINRVS